MYTKFNLSSIFSLPLSRLSLSIFLSAFYGRRGPLALLPNQAAFCETVCFTSGLVPLPDSVRGSATAESETRVAFYKLYKGELVPASVDRDASGHPRVLLAGIEATTFPMDFGDDFPKVRQF